MPNPASRITAWLDRASPAVLAAYAAAAAFSTYFCMYAFRKPFTAAEFQGESFLESDVTLKTAFVISQILGYTLCKYLGIKFCAEMPRSRRAAVLVAMIVWAEAALVLFAIVPPSGKVAAMFLNGMPLGMVWGLVVWYLEGRRTSELLLAALSCSYIVAAAVVKDVGRWLLGMGVTEAWMPAAAGGLFLLPFFAAVWALNRLPAPDAEDVATRVKREPMDGARRWEFARRFLFGVAMLCGVYFFVTAYRDFRDVYGIQVFKGLGYEGEPGIFTMTEVPIAFGVMAAMAGLNLIKDNRRGMVGAYAIMAFGLLLVGGATLLLDVGAINGLVWMILIGLGAFLAYVPYGSVLFDRTMASTRFVGTAVFAIYLADAVGYTGSVVIQLFKDLITAELNHLEFLRGYSYFLTLVGTAGLAASCLYFLAKTRRVGRAGRRP